MGRTPHADLWFRGASAGSEAAGDHFDAECLVGAFEDRQHPGVDEQATDFVLLRVSEATMDLHRLTGHHSAALHTYALTMLASIAPSPCATSRATWYENWRLAWMIIAIRPSFAAVS